MNVAVVQGTVARAPEEWLVGSQQVLGFDVVVRRPNETADTVPVRWEEPAPWAAELAVGEEVLVTGRVRRRFFRTGRGTQSRTEVLASAVVRVGSGRRPRRAVQAALEAALAGLPVEGLGR